MTTQHIEHFARQAGFAITGGADSGLDLSPANVDRVEEQMLQLPQRDAPVKHHFIAGVYIREVNLPAGSFAIGHEHRFAHLNLMLKGHVTALMEDGTTVEYVAPCQFVGKPGRKLGMIHEDTVWLNIFPTNETNVAKLEDQLFNRSDAWFANQLAITGMESLRHQPDRADFFKAIEELGYPPEVVREQSEDARDQIPMPPGSCRTLIAPSPIEGKGVFATDNIESGEVIGPAKLGGQRTPIGRYTNHAAKPNAKMVEMDGDIYLVATQRLRGCYGGNPGDEATVDYRQVRAVAAKATPTKHLCQA